MFTRILVPLDGLQQSEATLPIVAYMAGKCHSNVTLLHIMERHPPTRAHGQRHLENETDAMNYLESQATVMKHTGGKVFTRIIDETSDGVADSLAAIARSGDGFDLIAMCRHGHYRLFDSTKNCLARQVASRVDIPMLVKCINPSEKDFRYRPLHLTLVVDISGNNDHLLDMAKEIALKCGLRVSMIVLCPEIRAMGNLGSGFGFSLVLAVNSTNREIEYEAGSISHKYEREFRESGVQMVSNVVSYRSSDQVADLLRVMSTDLIVMSLPSLKQSTPLKTFDISRFSHLPSLMVPA